MKARVVIFVRDTSSWPALHNYKVSWLYSKEFKVMEQTRNCIWNYKWEIRQKEWKRELLFFYATHCHDLFYITVEYHDYIPNDFQVMERTWNSTWQHHWKITQKVWKPELSFLYVTHHHDLFYITVKYHDYISKGIKWHSGHKYT